MREEQIINTVVDTSAVHCECARQDELKTPLAPYFWERQQCCQCAAHNMNKKKIKLHVDLSWSPSRLVHLKWTQQHSAVDVH